MAWRPRSSLLRRLDAVTRATRRKVAQRRVLREHAEGARLIRRAALGAGLDPAAIRGLAAIAYMPGQLAALGLTPAQDRADADFIAHDPALASHQGWAERVADRLPRFAHAPPHGRDARLDDWYAWALARHHPPPAPAAPRDAHRPSQGRGMKWKRRLSGEALHAALQRMRFA